MLLEKKISIAKANYSDFSAFFLSNSVINFHNAFFI